MTQLAVTERKGFAPATITEAIQFSEMLAASQMVPKQYQGKPQDIMVCVQWGYEIGLAPMQALQNIAVINGKPSVYGDAAMALVQASPVCEGVEEYFEGEGTPNPVAVCVAHRKGRKPVVAKFSIEDAKRAGLWGKQGPWQAYPKRMMQMRARGFALRDAFPDVLKGLITAEEAQDYPTDDKPRPAKDITPRNPLDMVAAPAPAIEVAEPEVIEPVVEAVSDVSIEEPTSDTSEQHVDAVVIDEHIEAQPLPEPDRVPGEDDEEPLPDATPVGLPLFVPGKPEPHSYHPDIDKWAEAYEDMGDKIARAGKRPARERMTILREFKEANEQNMKRVDAPKRVRHIASYQSRLKALGAAL